MLIDNAESGGRLVTTAGESVPHFPLADPDVAMPASPESLNEHVYDIEHSNSTFDDVFGTSPPGTSAESRTLDSPIHQSVEASNREPSDIPRLQDVHGKAGYRDGIAEAKGKYVQEGFDEGYTLGAELGLRVGWVTGCLEGIVKAMSQCKGDPDMDAALVNCYEDAAELFQSARQELSIQNVFGADYFGGDGIWTYQVPVQVEDDATFHEVADAHPLVRKWTATVRDMSSRWDVDLTILEWEEGKRDEDG